MERLYRIAVVIHLDQLGAPVTLSALISALTADQFHVENVWLIVEMQKIHISDDNLIMNSFFIYLTEEPISRKWKWIILMSR